MTKVTGESRRIVSCHGAIPPMTSAVIDPTLVVPLSDEGSLRCISVPAGGHRPLTSHLNGTSLHHDRRSRLPRGRPQHRRRLATGLALLPPRPHPRTLPDQRLARRLPQRLLAHLRR